MILECVNGKMHTVIYSHGNAQDATNAMIELVQGEQRKFPEYGQVLLVWETRVNFRRQMPGYKANRPERTPEEKLFIAQTRELFLAKTTQLGWTSLIGDNVEADDTLAALACRLPGPHLIVSNDSDLGIAVNKTTHLLARGEVFTLASLGDLKKTGKDTWAVRTPLDIIFYKATVGDPGDGYGGLKGIGPKAFEKAMTALDQEDVVSLLIRPEEALVMAAKSRFADAEKLLLAIANGIVSFKECRDLAVLYTQGYAIRKTTVADTLC